MYTILRIHPTNQDANSCVTTRAKGDSPEDALRRFANSPDGILVVHKEGHLRSALHRDGDLFVVFNPASSGYVKLLRVEPVQQPRYEVMDAVCSGDARR